MLDLWIAGIGQGMIGQGQVGQFATASERPGVPAGEDRNVNLGVAAGAPSCAEIRSRLGFQRMFGAVVSGLGEC
jgi:hypothetical protein